MKTVKVSKEKCGGKLMNFKTAVDLIYLGAMFLL